MKLEHFFPAHLPQEEQTKVEPTNHLFNRYPVAIEGFHAGNKYLRPRKARKDVTTVNPLNFIIQEPKYRKTLDNRPEIPGEGSMEEIFPAPADRGLIFNNRKDTQMNAYNNKSIYFYNKES